MRDGDRESLTAFVREWSPLLRVGLLLTGDRWLAEDLLHTSLKKTSPRWRGLRPALGLGLPTPGDHG